MELDVVVPPGCLPGSEVIVEADGTPFYVTIPPDIGEGDIFTVIVGAPQNEVQVTVPAGCASGASFLVAIAGTEFEVVVPEGCGPGSELTVQVPAPSDVHSNSEVQRVSSRASSSTDSDSSDSSDSESPKNGGPKFPIGAPAEVLRTDGLWTLVTVVEYDANGDTYTVQLSDGRCKYFVEPEDLRIPRFLLTSTANI